MNLEEIKQRLEGTTVVNWEAKGTLVVSMSGLMSIEVGDSEDAKFIAHARDDMFTLITEIERLREALTLIQFEALEVLDGFVADSDVVRLLDIATKTLEGDRDG